MSVTLFEKSNYPIFIRTFNSIHLGISLPQSEERKTGVDKVVERVNWNRSTGENILFQFLTYKIMNNVLRVSVVLTVSSVL